MLDLQDVSLQFTGKYLFENASFRVHYGDKLALAGANGTGKTSLLRIIAGEVQPDSGKVLAQKNLRVGYLPQEVVSASRLSVFEEAYSSLEDIVQLQEKEAELTRLLRAPDDDEQRDELIEQLGEVHHRLEASGSYSAESRVEKVLEGLGFATDDLNRPVNELSGGWQMRVALAKLLIAETDLLMLDEPTNHLDYNSLEWLTGYLNGYKGALLLVSHDLHFVTSVTRKTAEIFRNKVALFNGTYDKFLLFKEERDAQLEHQYELQQKKIKETEKFIERFRYKATKARQVQSRIKQLEKIDLIEPEDSVGTLSLRFPPAPPSGRAVITLQGVAKSYGNKQVLHGVDLVIERGERMVFLGPNGAGKSTLSKIIAGKTALSAGSRVTGHNVSIAYYSQDVADEMDRESEIIEEVGSFAEAMSVGQLRGLLGSFLFSGDDVFKKIGVLSGGEKSRVALAKLLLTKANLLVLDEPTNHLDMKSKKVLQDALLAFEGAMVIVSHDIDFLRPIGTKVLELNRDRITYYYGGIDHFMAKRAAEQQPEIGLADKRAADAGATRKDQKRVEAEKRQEKYKRTKGLVKEVEQLEAEIAALEEEQARLEAELADPAVYADGTLAREKTAAYGAVKKKVETAMALWTEKSEALAAIEKEYE